MNTILALRPLRFAPRNFLLLLTLACIWSLALSQGSVGTAQAAVAPQADLSVIKTGDESAPRGGTITYSLLVINNGPDDATNTMLIDQIPAHTTFVSATTSQGTVSFDGTFLFINFGTINGPEVDGNISSANATLVVRVDSDTPQGTTISNTASVAANMLDPDSSNNSATALTAVSGPFTGDLIISEFRLRGPAGANDEFIEIYNNTVSDILVAATDTSTGYGIAASDGLLRCTIPNGTRIPASGHFLCVNSVGYSLGAYPAGNGTTATGDATYTTDIPDNVGIALFTTSNSENFSLASRFDAVGSTAELNALYRENTGYAALTGLSIDYSLFRDECGKGGSATIFGPCPSPTPKDTDNNANDFVFADTNATSATANATVRRLGAPGPQNLSSPVQRNETLSAFSLDATKGSASAPNRVRDFTSDPANNSTFGTLDIRRRIVNTTDENVTRLRFRVIDITTLPAPSGIADLRARTSTPVVVSNIADEGTCNPAQTPCAVTVQGTTLEQPPTQTNGGGFNSSLSADTVTLSNALAPGASVNVRFLLGIQQTGSFRFFINIEALTGPVVQEARPARRPTKGMRAVESTNNPEEPARGGAHPISAPATRP